MDSSEAEMLNGGKAVRVAIASPNTPAVRGAWLSRLRTCRILEMPVSCRRPHTSTASPRFLPGVLLFGANPVVSFGTRLPRDLTGCR
jgi:hypothetical protein